VVATLDCRFFAIRGAGSARESKPRENQSHLHAMNSLYEGFSITILFIRFHTLVLELREKHFSGPIQGESESNTSDLESTPGIKGFIRR
jgi:hypothetical protein